MGYVSQSFCCKIASPPNHAIQSLHRARWHPAGPGAVTTIAEMPDSLATCCEATGGMSDGQKFRSNLPSLGQGGLQATETKQYPPPRKCRTFLKTQDKIQSLQNTMHCGGANMIWKRKHQTSTERKITAICGHSKLARRQSHQKPRRQLVASWRSYIGPPSSKSRDGKQHYSYASP